MFFPLLIPVGNMTKKSKITVVTFVLIILNVFVHVINVGHSGSYEQKLQEKMTEEYIGTSLTVYREFILDHTDNYSLSQLELAQETVNLESPETYSLMKGMYSDHFFSKNSETYKGHSDPVLFSWWQEKTREIEVLKLQSLTYLMGIKIENSWWSFVTYQFTHGGWFHLFSNMLFLLIIGRVLEPLVGGVSFLLLYLVFGVCAGWFYIQFGGASDLPLVGASGSISGLLSLWFVLFWRRNFAYFYFLFIPKKEYLGVIYLPGFVGLYLWLFYDLVGFLNHEYSQVAFSAHVGGHLTGLIIGVVLLTILIQKGKASIRGILPYVARLG